MTDNSQNASAKQARKIAMVVLATVVSFFLSWSPYAIVSLGSTLTGAPLTSVSVALVPDLMAKASVVYNPILYVLINGSFRRTLVGILRGSVHKIAPVMGPSSNNTNNTPNGSNGQEVKTETHQD